MTDCFALFDEPRRPWLNPDHLKQKFLELSAQFHPDRTHAATPAEKAAAQQRYVALNAAFQCLIEPKTRLRHLLELELQSKPEEIQQIPNDLLDLFMDLGQLTRKIDVFIKEKASVTSPLLQVQLFEQNQAWADELSSFQRSILARRDVLLADLKNVDAGWMSAAPGSSDRRLLLKRLEEFYRLLGYFSRWTAQLQERLVQLAV